MTNASIVTTNSAVSSPLDVAVVFERLDIKGGGSSQRLREGGGAEAYFSFQDDELTDERRSRDASKLVA